MKHICLALQISPAPGDGRQGAGSFKGSTSGGFLAAWKDKGRRGEQTHPEPCSSSRLDAFHSEPWGTDHTNPRECHMSASELLRGCTGWASPGWGRVISWTLGLRRRTEQKEAASKAGSRGIPGVISPRGRPWLPPGLRVTEKPVPPLTSFPKAPAGSCHQRQRPPASRSEEGTFTHN